MFSFLNKRYRIAFLDYSSVGAECMKLTSLCLFVDFRLLEGPGIDGYPFPDSFGSTCAALCRNVLYSENGTIESCQNSTSLYGQPGCLCRDISFLGAPTLPPTPFPSTVPPTPTPLPTQIPVPAPTVLPTDEASLLALASGAVWAGQKSEGLFNAIDRLGLGPGGAKTDMVRHFFRKKSLIEALAERVQFSLVLIHFFCSDFLCGARALSLFDPIFVWLSVGNDWRCYF